MAASAKAYGPATVHFYNGDVDWASDTIKLALLDDTYAPNQGTDEFFSDIDTHEIAAGGGYTAGGFTLTGCATSYDSGTRELRFTADDLDPALTPASPFRYAVVYKDTGTPSTSPVLGYINFGANQDPAGLHFPIQWPATGVIYDQAA